VNIQTSPLYLSLPNARARPYFSEGKASPVMNKLSRTAEEVLQNLQLAKTPTVNYTKGNSAEGSGFWQKMLSG
jgi:hypothetical protein